MTSEELAAVLSRMYVDAPYGESSTMIHLFGIRYADEIRKCGASVDKIVKWLEVPDSYAIEVRKGIGLARYVELRPDCDFRT